MYAAPHCNIHGQSLLGVCDIYLINIIKMVVCIEIVLQCAQARICRSKHQFIIGSHATNISVAIIIITNSSVFIDRNG